jgi:NAD(P)-dependent dehydrogenase (short-subunit alcohol dehydrogenase family)
MTGRTALVTGASRGIGAAIAARLRQGGANVLTPSRGELDLASNTSMDAYLASLKEPVDILVNNAGINRLASGIEAADGDILDTLQVNLIAPIRLIRGIAPQMVARRYGRIVNISSIWSMVSKPGRVSYATSKSGLNGMTRTLAVELAPFNVLVNAVAPGYVNTELTRQNNTKQEIDAIRKTIPLQRLAEPDEIATVVSFLCSEENSYITGQTILVDGGFTCQ